MFTTRIGSPTPIDAGVAPTSKSEKRTRESSSDEEKKTTPHVSKYSRSTAPALARDLRNRLLAQAASRSDDAIMNGPFHIQNRISDDDTSEYSAVYRVHSSNSDTPLVAKILDESPDNSPISENGIDPLTLSLQQFKKIGAHENINKIHGIASLEIDGTTKDALIMDAGDMTVLDAMDHFEQARVDGKLGDAEYFGTVLPFLARGMLNGAAHCAKAHVAHCDIDPANLLLFKDGRPPQLIDLHLSKEFDLPASALWPAAERTGANPFSQVYPIDAKGIAGTLRLLAAPAVEGGMSIDSAHGDSLPEVNAMRSLLSRIDGHRRPQQTPDASDFNFLTLGSDEKAREVLTALFG